MTFTRIYLCIIVTLWCVLGWWYIEIYDISHQVVHRNVALMYFTAIPVFVIVDTIVQYVKEKRKKKQEADVHLDCDATADKKL